MALFIQLHMGKGETNNMKGALGEFEELVLLVIGILVDDAYGLAMVDERIVYSMLPVDTSGTGESSK